MREIYNGENMSFLVLGRMHVALEKYTPEIPHILISITDPSNGQTSDEIGPAKLFPSDKRLATLRLEFFDIDEAVGNIFPMTDEQAKDIFNFVDLWSNKVNLIVVHCEAGIARSSGVAAALSNALNGEDLFFLSNILSQ